MGGDVVEVEPLGLRVWGHDLWTIPPNSQGYLALAGARIAELADEGQGVLADPSDPAWARLRVEGTARLADIVADTGSAVALCSLTTIIGYSSLLVARNRALQSFGLLADLGEITCLIAALVALPAVVRLLWRPRPAQDA